MKDYIGTGVLSLAALMTLFEVTKIKINPWSWLFGLIGKLMNADIEKRLSDLSKEMETVKSEVESVATAVTAVDAKGDEREAKNCRARILRFGDEILHKVRHSKEHFEQIIIDIDEYNRYCEAHAGFKNSVTVHTTQLILDTYDACIDQDDFLK